MTKIDQFESVFRSATKTLFEYELIEINKVLVITDLIPDDSQGYAERVQKFLGNLGADVNWISRSGSDYVTVEELLERVQEVEPDLICTYRNLKSEAWKWPFGIGIHLTVLTQALPHPVLVLPHPKEHYEPQHISENTSNITVITDHLTGDHRLINFAIRFAHENGILYLTHVEDDVQYRRYMEIISKIPELDTETAERAIHEQLMKEPHDYVESCIDALRESGINIKIEDDVRMGHRLSQVKQLIEEHNTDLLVINSKDEDQIAMHGLAHSLVVELRSIPILML
jgi:hypothetical protein